MKSLIVSKDYEALVTHALEDLGDTTRQLVLADYCEERGELAKGQAWRWLARGHTPAYLDRAWFWFTPEAASFTREIYGKTDFESGVYSQAHKLGVGKAAVLPGLFPPRGDVAKGTRWWSRHTSREEAVLFAVTNWKGSTP